MLGNSWFKKEKPLLGLTGMGGGADSKLVAGGPSVFSASGGTETTPGNGYKYHTFNSPGADTFIVASGAADIQLLVVAGGGGAGGYRCSGGGAGGLIYYGTTPSTSTAAASFRVTSGTYNIQVGAGGAGGDPDSSSNGTPSYFGPVVSTGGGAGMQTPIGGNGGSGGGWGIDQGGNPNVDGGTGISGQGFPGGGINPFGGGGGVTGGGGGAGARGGNSSGPRGGHGGDGLQFPDFTGPLIGVPALNPLNGYFAGGGGGGAGPSNYGFTGGTGGSGGGASSNGAGFTNSGGGAASGYPQSNNTPQPGGPGIVVVRYQII